MPKKAKKKKEEEKKPKPKPTLIKERERDYIYAIGRRKNAISRIRLYKNGKGQIIINEKEYKKYFPHFELQEIIVAPLQAVGKLNDYNFSIKVRGSGFHSQAEAVKMGISRALIKINKNFRKTIKPLGYLTRDPRKKERKKPGLKRARRAPQWQKR